MPRSFLQVVSTVLFLACCTCCGPTLVLDQTAEEAEGGRAWVAHPVQGALLAYPGNLLHGVLPGTSACLSACIGDLDVTRETIKGANSFEQVL